MKIDDSTIFVGVYGSLKVHDWLDAGSLGEDAYSLFHSRAVSLGWATSSAGDPGSELWGMNDAGQDWTSPRQSAPLAWFQVGLVSPDGLALPVQPLLACVEDSIERVGRLHLDAVQLLLPLRLHRADPSRLLSGLNWFGPVNPGAGLPIRVTLDAGEDDVVQRQASRILDAARRRHSGPFTLDRCAPADGASLREPVVGDLWLGAGRHPVAVTGFAPEWGFAAAGWLVEFLADVCIEVGVSASVLTTVEAPRF